MTEYKKITAKHPGKCSECHNGIAPGDEVLWLKDKGVKHVECPTSVRAFDPAVFPAEQPWHGVPYPEALTVDGIKAEMEADMSTDFNSADYTADEQRAYETQYLAKLRGATRPLPIHDWLRTERASLQMTGRNTITDMLAHEQANKSIERTKARQPEYRYSTADQFSHYYADAHLVFEIVARGTLDDGTKVYKGVSEYEAGSPAVVYVDEAYITKQRERGAQNG